MKTYLKTKDYFLTGEEFDLQYDEDLDILITKPRPHDISKYYESENYISHTDANKSLIDKIYSLVKKFAIHNKISLIENLNAPSKTLIDIGAGTGDFIKAISSKGWVTHGVEPNELARTIAKDKEILLQRSISKITSKSNVITLWHVLEHLPNLNNQIEAITKLLNKNGYLIIAVPNYKSFDAKKYKSHWAAYDVPRHLWHFSRKSIPLLFEPYGYTLTQTKPMYFDSFYVSILSEKYKHGRSNYFRAFLTGLLSNLKAFINGEYSSLIYILRKQ